jgi:nucleotidyltransferase substrate binding protein (TIGR01987 family)
MGKDIRWQQRFSNYKKALHQLGEAVALSKNRELSDLEKQGVIQAFEYTHELAWTTLKDFLDFRGQRDIYGSKDASRKAFQLGIVEDGEGWMDMIQSRNKTSHTYNKETAEEIVAAVTTSYYILFLNLEEKLGEQLLDVE